MRIATTLLYLIVYICKKCCGNTPNVSNNYKTNNMTNIGCKTIFKVRNLLLVLLSIQISACTGQVKEKSVTDTIENQVNTQPLIIKQSTTFPQIHTNLNLSLIHISEPTRPY